MAPGTLGNGKNFELQIEMTKEECGRSKALIQVQASSSAAFLCSKYRPLLLLFPLPVANHNRLTAVITPAVCIAVERN